MQDEASLRRAGRALKRVAGDLAAEKLEEGSDEVESPYSVSVVSVAVAPAYRTAGMARLTVIAPTVTLFAEPGWTPDRQAQQCWDGTWTAAAVPAFGAAAAAAAPAAGPGGAAVATLDVDALVFFTEIQEVGGVWWFRITAGEKGGWVCERRWSLSAQGWSGGLAFQWTGSTAHAGPTSGAEIAVLLQQVIGTLAGPTLTHLQRVLDNVNSRQTAFPGATISVTAGESGLQALLDDTFVRAAESAGLTKSGKRLFRIEFKKLEPALKALLGEKISIVSSVGHVLLEVSKCQRAWMGEAVQTLTLKNGATAGYIHPSVIIAEVLHIKQVREALATHTEEGCIHVRYPAHTTLNTIKTNLQGSVSSEMILALTEDMVAPARDEHNAIDENNPVVLTLHLADSEAVQALRLKLAPAGGFGEALPGACTFVRAVASRGGYPANKKGKDQMATSGGFTLGVEGLTQALITTFVNFAYNGDDFRRVFAAFEKLAGWVDDMVNACASGFTVPGSDDVLHFCFKIVVDSKLAADLWGKVACFTGISSIFHSAFCTSTVMNSAVCAHGKCEPLKHDAWEPVTVSRGRRGRRGRARDRGRRGERAGPAGADGGVECAFCAGVSARCCA